MASPLLRGQHPRGLPAGNIGSVHQKDLASSGGDTIVCIRTCAAGVVAASICALVVLGVWSMATVPRDDVQRVCAGSLLWWYVGASMVAGCCTVLPAMRLAHCTGEGLSRGVVRPLCFSLAISLSLSIWGYYEIMWRGCAFDALSSSELETIALAYASCFGVTVVYILAWVLMRVFIR